MIQVLAILGEVIFTVLGLWHFYWAFGGTVGKAAAVPSVDGASVFTPSRLATILVGTVLLSFALLVTATSGMISLPLSGRVLSWLCYGLAAVLFARAVGEFKLVGFFKQVHGSAFARLDTFLYSPLCLVLAFIVCIVGINHAA